MKYLRLTTLALGAALALAGYADEGHENETTESSDQAPAMEEMEHAHMSAVGSPAEAAEADRTIQVVLNDQMRIVFDDSFSAIQGGETIHFVVTNEGKIPHEFSVGSDAEQQAHAAMMRQMPGMMHSDGTTLTLQPGTTAELTWHFEGEGPVMFSCNLPGHFEAGMFQHRELHPE